MDRTSGRDIRSNVPLHHSNTAATHGDADRSAQGARGAAQLGVVSARWWLRGGTTETTPCARSWKSVLWKIWAIEKVEDVRVDHGADWFHEA